MKFFVYNNAEKQFFTKSTVNDYDNQLQTQTVGFEL
jgi:hypothetical protein